MCSSLSQFILLEKCYTIKHVGIVAFEPHHDYVVFPPELPNCGTKVSIFPGLKSFREKKEKKSKFLGFSGKSREFRHFSRQLFRGNREYNVISRDFLSRDFPGTNPTWHCVLSFRTYYWLFFFISLQCLSVRANCFCNLWQRQDVSYVKLIFCKEQSQIPEFWGKIQSIRTLLSYEEAQILLGDRWSFHCLASLGAPVNSPKAIVLVSHLIANLTHKLQIKKMGMEEMKTFSFRWEVRGSFIVTKFLRCS